MSLPNVPDLSGLLGPLRSLEDQRIAHKRLRSALPRHYVADDWAERFLSELDLSRFDFATGEDAVRDVIDELLDDDELEGVDAFAQKEALEQIQSAMMNTTPPSPRAGNVLGLLRNTVASAYAAVPTVDVARRTVDKKMATLGGLLVLADLLQAHVSE